MTRRIDDETLSRWLDSELDASDRTAVEDAIRTGTEDADHVARLRAQDDRLRQWFETESADTAHLAESVRAGFANKGAGTRFSSRHAWWMPAAAAAAIVVAGLVGFDYMLERRVNDALEQMRSERASDLALMATAMQDVLESQESGTEVAFQNPETGLAFRIKPQRTWKSASGHWCREFVEVIGGQKVSDAPLSTACRIAKQRWVRVVTALPGWQEPVLLDAAIARDL